MDEITLPATIGDDKKLVLDVPQDTPSGPVEVTIRSVALNDDEISTRDSVRAKFKAAQFLARDIPPPSGVVPLDSQELLVHGRLSANARPSEELIDEDRGTY